MQNYLHILLDNVQIILHTLAMSKFTDGELKVMRILWKHGEMKPADIQSQFSEPIKNPALRSYLSILLEKGHVTRRMVGKAFHYQARTKPNSAFRAMCRQMVETFFGGSSDEMLQHLIKEKSFSDQELLRLKHLVEKKTERKGIE